MNIHWTEVLCGHFSISLFWLALMILKWSFAQTCAFQLTKDKRCVRRVFYHYNFLVQKCKNQLLKKLRSSFYRIEVQVITNPSSRLEKKFNICIFWYFRKSSAAHTKIVARVLLNVTMLYQSQYSLINPFSNDIFSRLEPTSGFNVKF